MFRDPAPAGQHFAGELAHLRSFYYAALYQSFTRAAEQLSTTQPSVSTHIKTLENLVGQSLFERHARGAILTPAGQALFDLAKPLVEGIDQLQGRLAERLGNQVTQEIRLAAGHELLLHVAGPAMREYRSLHPDVRLVVFSSDRVQTQAMVARDEVDFGITSGAVMPEIVDFQHILSDELVLICPKTHPLAALGTVNIADVAPYPMLMPNPASSTRAAIETAFTQADCELRVAMELERWYVIKEFVALDLGIAFVPGFSVAQDADRLAIRRVRAGLPPLAYGIVSRRGRHLPASARSLMQLIRTQGQSLELYGPAPFRHP